MGWLNDYGTANREALTAYNDQNSGIQPVANWNIGNVNFAGPTQYQQFGYNAQLQAEQARQELEQQQYQYAVNAVQQYNIATTGSAAATRAILDERKRQEQQAALTQSTDLSRRAAIDTAKMVNTAGANGAMGNTLNKMIFAAGYSLDKAQGMIKGNLTRQLAQDVLQGESVNKQTEANFKIMPLAPNWRAAQLRTDAITNNFLASIVGNPQQQPNQIYT